MYSEFTFGALHVLVLPEVIGEELSPSVRVYYLDSVVSLCFYEHFIALG